MDMRRLERGGGAQQPQENEMEAKLRQWKSGKDQGVPRAAQSMMQIPQSPIYADDDEPMQPPPKGSLPKESASYSYGTGADDHADAGTSLVDPAQADGAPPNRQAARGLVGALGANRQSASYKAMAMQSYTSMKQADKDKEKVEDKKARVAAKAAAKAAAKHAQYDVGLSDEDQDEASPGSKSSGRSRGTRSGKSSPSFSRGSRHGSPSAASIKSATPAGTLSGRSGLLSPAKSKSSFSRDSGSPSYRRQPGVMSPHSSRDGLQSPASRRSSLLSSPTGSPKASAGRLNPSERRLAEQRISIPGEPEHRDFSDSDSDVGPTTSESEEEEMGAAERIDMMERANGTPSRALVPRSRSPSKAPSSAATRTKGKIQASLYVAAKQPPWVEAALAEKKAMEGGYDYSDSSEDERDRTREGKAGTKVCRKACGSCVKDCCTFTSEPDTVELENPPHREWERAEKALSAEQEGITKRWRNCWGRCSPKRLTLVAQLRLCMLGGCGLSCFCCAFTASTRTSSKPRQLLPQVVGYVLILANAFGCGWAADQTGTRLFGERNYMLCIFSLLCMLSLQFMCEHHREVHHGQLLCRFEGRTWQVLNVNVRDQLAKLGTSYMRLFRVSWLLAWIYYAVYLYWAASKLPIESCTEAATTSVPGDADNCDGVVLGLESSATDCGAVMTTADDSEPACVYVSGDTVTTTGTQYVWNRMVGMMYPLLVGVCTAWECLLETTLLCQRIDAFTDGLGSAQYVFTRPEAQAEHDLIMQATETFSKRWSKMLSAAAFASFLQVGLLAAFFVETTWSPEGRAARWPPPEPLFVFVFTVVLWGATARVAIHGERLISSAVAVSSARINIKGMLGRTSWCKYFMSLPIGIQLKSGVNVHAENLALGVGVCVIFLLYLGLDPTMCSAGWFTCEGVQPRGSFETYQATGMGLVGEQGDGEG